MRVVTLENSTQIAYETFAELHPVEAFDQDKQRFCDYFRTKHVGASNEMIEEIIKEHR